MTQSLTAFEAFKAELMAANEDEIAHALALRLDLATAGMSEAFAGSTEQPERRIRAVLEFGLLAIASTAAVEHEPASHYSGNYPWLRLAQGTLRDAAQQDPEHRAHLLSTVFFAASPKTRRGLNRIINASVEPAGWYENTAFRNGVALGRVAISDRAVERLLPRGR